MKPLRPILFLLCLSGTVCALSEMPLFLIDYQAYQVWLSNSFRLFDFDDDGRAVRLAGNGLEMRMAMNGAAKLKFRHVSLCVKSDFRTRSLQAEPDHDWALGPGDIELLAFRPVNGRWLAGARAVLPTASYGKALGQGCARYGGFFAFRYDLDWTGEAQVTWSNSNPDDIRPGLETIVGLGWENLFTTGLFFVYQRPDRVPAGGFRDEASYAVRVTLGLLDDQFGALKAFFSLFSDVVGKDTPLQSGISAGAAF